MKTKIFKGAIDAVKSLSNKTKHEASVVKLAGVKNYSKLKMKRIKRKYKSLNPKVKAGLEGFGTGLKYGTMGVGALELGKSLTGKRKDK
tara:strand:- start:261 stop:527 length:267 start_codon:yes stop_codon:yes gene_type:complete